MPDDAEPFGIVPRRTERRGEFPAHDVTLRYPLGPVPAETAARVARERYERWKADHE